MLQNESFTKNYNLTTEKIQTFLNYFRNVNNEFFHVQTNSKNILIEDEKKIIAI